MPSRCCLSLPFSPDGAHLAVGHSGDPFVTIYKREGDAFTKLNDIPPLSVAALSGSVAYSPVGVCLVVTHLTSPFLTIYVREGDAYIKREGSPVSLTARPPYYAFSPDGVHLALGFSAAPFVLIVRNLAFECARNLTSDGYRNFAAKSLLGVGMTLESVQAGQQVRVNLLSPINDAWCG